MNTTSNSPTSFRNKSKTLGYKSSPQAFEHALEEQQDRDSCLSMTTTRASTVSSNSTSASAQQRSHSTLRKQYFRHCRTDSENERENNKRMSKTLQANISNEERWKKHQSLKMDPLERVGYSCSSESNRNNIFSKFISKLSKKKSSNNLF